MLCADTATNVSPTVHGTMANNVDAKFAAAFSSTQATAAQKSGRYASYLADRVNAILSCVVLID